MFRARGIVTGLTSAVAYIMVFISVKTYLNMENVIGLSGTMLFYSIIHIIG